MQFVEKFEPLCRMTSDDIISLGLFDSYEDANDAAILQASVALPQECMKAYQINKVYINIPAYTTADPDPEGNYTT